MDFLEWIKAESVRASEQGAINLTGSGYAVPPDRLREYLTVPGTPICEWASSNYCNEWGLEPLIQEIRHRYQLTAKHRVLSEAGSSSALGLVFEAIRQAYGTGEILVESPVYDPLFRVPEYLGFSTKHFERCRTDGYRIDVEDVAHKVTSTTRCVVATRLHNPTGADVSDDELAKLSRRVESRNPSTVILIDETFTDFMPRRASAATHGRNIVAVNSLSKSFGFGLLRCGWIIACDPFAQHMQLAWLRLQNIGSKLTEALGTAVLRNAEPILAERNVTLVRNRLALQEFREELSERLLGSIPSFGCVDFPRQAIPASDEWFERLRDDAKVAVTPGRFFGVPQHFRIGIGGDTQLLLEGLHRLRVALLKC